MLDTLRSLLALGGIALAAWGIGRPICRWLRVDRRGSRESVAGWEAAVWNLAIGLLAAGLALTAWGLVGGLQASVITWLTVAAASYGAAEAIHTWRRNPRVLPESRRSGRSRLAKGAATTLVLVAAGASLFSALAPAVAGDALCYHLELPKLFLAQGEIGFLPDHENSTFPLLAEIWFLWALAVDSAVTAQLVHWGLGLLLAAGSVMLARPIVGRGYAWLAGLIVLTVPGVTNQMAAPLNDVALAAFTTLALVAWQRGTRGASKSNALSARGTRHSERSEESRWLLVAGVMAGGALSIKYVALIFAAAVAATTCWAILRRAEARWTLARAAAIVSVVAVTVAGVWYVRAAYHRGNPVYPFFARVAGTAGPPTLRESKTPLKWRAGDLATAPWRVTMQPDRFGGRGHQLGPLFLLTLPVGLMIVRRRGVGALIGMAAVYVVIWYALRQNVRFLFPLVPILAVIAAAAIVAIRRWPAAPRAVGWASCLAATLLGAMIPAYRTRQHVAVALGWESREEFLVRHEPTYAAACFVNERLPANAHVLSQDYRAYYFQRTFTRENVFRRRSQFQQTLDRGGATDLVPLLLGQGFTHVLLAEGDGETARYNGTLRLMVDAAQSADPSCTNDLLSYRFRAPDGSQRHYRLLELVDPTGRAATEAVQAREQRPLEAAGRAIR